MANVLMTLQNVLRLEYAQQDIPCALITLVYRVWGRHSFVNCIMLYRHVPLPQASKVGAQMDSPALKTYKCVQPKSLVHKAKCSVLTTHASQISFTVCNHRLERHQNWLAAAEDKSDVPTVIVLFRVLIVSKTTVSLNKWWGVQALHSVLCHMMHAQPTHTAHWSQTTLTI